MAKKIVVEQLFRANVKTGNIPKLTPTQIRLAALAMEKEIDERVKRAERGAPTTKDEIEVITEWL